MSILKWQVNSISSFASFFIAITHNSPLRFKLIHFILCIKGSNESPNFENFVCSGENLCHFPYVIFQTTSQVFFKFCLTLQCHEIQLLCPFLVKALYTLVKSSALKWKFLRLSSSRVKIRQIPYVNFERRSQFLFRFFIILQCHYL